MAFSRDVRPNFLRIKDGPTFVNSFSKPLLYTGNTQYLALYFAALQRHWDMEFDWYNDAAGQELLISTFFSFRQGDTLAQSIPVFGPYVRIQAFSVNNGFAGEYAMNVWPVAGAMNPLHTADTGNILIDIEGTNVGAGATTSFDSTIVRPGPAFWFAFFDVGVNNDIFLESLDTTGGTKSIHHLSNTGTGNVPGYDIYLPASHVRVRANNQDGVGRLLFSSLVAKPLFN